MSGTCTSPPRVSKKMKKTITLETKLDILRRFNVGQKAVQIAKALGLASTTVRSIRYRDGSKIKEAIKTGTPLYATTMIRARSPLMLKMEYLLSIWIDNQVAQKMPLSRMLIQAKAKSLFYELKTKLTNDAGGSSSCNVQEELFEASQGWFERFKVRANLYGIPLTGESPSTDTDSAEHFREDLKIVIDEVGYCAKQIFSIAETGLFWKSLPNATFIAKSEDSAGFKASKERLALLLGGNAEGDFKFKPLLVYHSDFPENMKGHTKGRLPVHWRANKKARITAALFKDWLLTCAIPEMKAYCSKENLYFKTLILLDNIPAHPIYLNDLSENVKFVYFPTNISPMMHPMKYVISTFNSYYLRSIFYQLVSASNNQNKVTMLEFWNAFNIMNAIETISGAWNELKASLMNSVWSNVWPECVHEINGDLSELNDLGTVRQELVNLGNEFNIEGINESDIDELLASHNQEMSNEELIQMDFQWNYEQYDLGKFPKKRQFTSKRLSQALRLIDNTIDIIQTDDPDSERRMIANDISCYSEIYMDSKQNSVEQPVNMLMKDDTHTPYQLGNDREYDINKVEEMKDPLNDSNLPSDVASSDGTSNTKDEANDCISKEEVYIKVEPMEEEDTSEYVNVYGVDEPEVSENEANENPKPKSEVLSGLHEEFDLFGKYIAAQMKNMPFNLALVCQEKILSVMVQERLKYSSKN